MSKTKIVSFSMEKGGCTKTSGVLNTGVALSKLGLKVLLVDLDPQSHLTVGLGLSPESQKITITDLISTTIQGKEITKELVESSIISTNGIDIIPSNYFLMNFEYALKSSIGGEFALLEILKLIKNNYEMILIDCPSSTNIFTLNALVSANSVVIPIQPHFLNINGLQMILHTISQVKKKYNESLTIDGILVSMAQKNTNGYKEVINSLKLNYSETVNIFNTIIPQSVAVSDAPKYGLSVIDYSKNNPASKEYMNFAKEFISYGSNEQIKSA